MGLGLVAFLILGFYVAQRVGLFFYLARVLERVGSQRGWLSLSGSAAALDHKVSALYQRQSAFWGACLFHLMGWILGAGEVWLALYVIAPLVGLSPETGLSLSLAKRVRELMLGVPGLIAWHVLEARHAVGRGLSRRA